jgi:DNA (cytosine-5)-methyltransferase 1
MPNYLDIFAGAGGLSEGFIRAGYTPIAHIEMDKAACYTLKTRLAYKWLVDHNQEVLYSQYLRGIVTREELYDVVPDELLNSVLNYEISETCLEEIFKTIDGMLNGEPLELIVGGPPCQAYSLVGRARDENGMLGDQRNYLYILYAEFLNRYHPRYFVFENVVGLLSAKDTDDELYLEKMQRLFRECGYSVEYRLLNANDYGILQNRERVILIGKYGEHNDFYPEILTEKNTYIVQSIFEDLPTIHAGEGVCRHAMTMIFNSYFKTIFFGNTTKNNYCIRRIGVITVFYQFYNRSILILNELFAYSKYMASCWSNFICAQICSINLRCFF